MTAKKKVVKKTTKKVARKRQATEADREQGYIDYGAATASSEDTKRYVALMQALLKRERDGFIFMITTDGKVVTDRGGKETEGLVFGNNAETKNTILNLFRYLELGPGEVMTLALQYLNHYSD